ncbi:hypothetical protein [Microbacterium sp. XT11]|uniref:hypothetical protein n=1 Tax=Microbacterium sp. XT11 TaxID=367477 RepID=UPI000836DC79|nr:hypothetical protein [Microbacterium sp. XT11]
MTIERYVLPSGRIATLDTSQPVAAVEEARRTLVEGFGAVPENESAPAAVAAANRGENTTSSSEENEVNTPIESPTTDIREAIRSWALQYAAKTEAAARIVVNDPEFQEWAAEQIRRRPDFTIDKCARRWVDENGFVNVLWPDAATRSGWNVHIGANLGGEVSVSIDVEIDDVECPAVGASLGVLIAVVVDTDPSRTRPEPGVNVGDFFVSLPTISYWGVENTSDADADRLAALSRVMLRAAEALPAVAEFSRLLRGSERSMEIPARQGVTS